MSVRLGVRQLSEAAEKSKCLPAFLFGGRAGWTGSGWVTSGWRECGGVQGLLLSMWGDADSYVSTGWMYQCQACDRART